LLAARHGARRALFNSFARMPAAERMEVAAIVVLSGYTALNAGQLFL
jgi:hypothetical protein